MRKIRGWLLRFGGLFNKGRKDREFQEELESHIQMQIDDNLRLGMTLEEARRQAMIQMGGIESTQEAYREQRGLPVLETLLQDLRYGARMLRRNPGFAIVAILTLALGIGAISAVLSLVQGVLLTPPPYAKPDDVMLVESTVPERQGAVRPPTTEQWTGWQRDCKAFQGMAAYDWDFDSLILPDSTEVISGLEVTRNYFDVLGLKPLLGRTFEDGEITKNAEFATCAVIGYDLWQRTFHGDPHIVGQKIRFNRRPALTVVGVMPQGIRFLPSFGEEACPTYDVNARIEFWLPVEPDLSKPKRGSGNGAWSVVAALRPGAVRSEAEAELKAIAARQAQMDPYYKGLAVKVQPLREFLNRDGRRLLLPLAGTAALLFLISCGNIAGLLLARGLCRQHEYAVRCALGAGRRRIFAQVMIESLLLSLLGGGYGLALAMVIVRMLKAVGGTAIPRLDAVAIGWPELAFCFAASVIAAVLAGLLPAAHALRPGVSQAIKNAGSAGTAPRHERRWLGGIAMFQTALSLALLIGASLLTQTVLNLAGLRPGYDTDKVLTMSVMRIYGQAPSATQRDQRKDANNDFHQRALESVSSLPGVVDAAFVLGLPLAGNQSTTDEVKIEGGIDAPLAERASVWTPSVTEKYFDVMGIKILAGRGFRASDGEPKTPEAVVINETMARRYFGDENPVGRKLRFAWSDRPIEIIGVASDSRDVSLSQEPVPEVYFSFWRYSVLTKTLVVRAKSDPRALAGPIKRALRDLDPTAGVIAVKTMSQVRRDSMSAQIFAMRLLADFAIAGTALALVGIYGVLSLSVNSRNRELAVRMAVGARRLDILGLVLGEGLRLIALGVAGGFVVALLLTGIIRALLFGVGPSDPATFVFIGILFTAVAMLACYLPTSRATKANPLAALRCE
jgi:putative ABC transport system permease protein